MAPLPKRKHSKLRKGKRIATRKQTLPKLVVCPNCKRMKLPHTVCKYCGK
ncbi:50S ribosomal protein L32 [Candidatus Roizmanbacteria bacterium]|nr:50S ribosomal protein L32 [Candidatus Roizmanbacteria bacterium]